VRVEKVWVAGDVGRQIVNPSAGGNQVEGSAIDGVSQALSQALTFTKGRVDQSNFHDYPLLQLDDDRQGGADVRRVERAVLLP
jgi:isoquinoline 1-oxidoreductase beta subunit